MGRILRHSMRIACAQLGDSVAGAKIGVQSAENAGRIATAFGSRLAKLHLIEPFLRKTAGVIHYAPALQSIAETRMAMFGDAVVWHVGKSADVAGEIKNGSLDFVYVDGDHSYEGVKRDLDDYYPKIKPGGLFCGHDYYYPTQRWGNIPVRDAVNDWMFAGERKFEVWSPDWWHWKPRDKGDVAIEAMESLPDIRPASSLTPKTVRIIADLASGRCLEYGTGRGAGTVALLQGSDCIISVDHLEGYTDATRRAIPNKSVTFLHCRLNEHGWYDVSFHGKFCTVLVDGPPGPEGRRHALPSIWKNLAREFVFLMDDGRRAGEHAAVAEWEKTLPINTELLPTERGLWKITRRAP